MIIHNRRHRADIIAFYKTMMNDPDLYITLFYEVTGHLKNDIPTTDELGNEFIKYKIFKHWNKNRKLNKWKKVN